MGMQELAGGRIGSKNMVSQVQNRHGAFAIGLARALSSADGVIKELDDLLEWKR